MSTEMKGCDALHQVTQNCIPAQLRP